MLRLFRIEHGDGVPRLLIFRHIKVVGTLGTDRFGGYSDVLRSGNIDRCRRNLLCAFCRCIDYLCLFKCFDRLFGYGGDIGDCLFRVCRALVGNDGVGLLRVINIPFNKIIEAAFTSGVNSIPLVRIRHNPYFTDIGQHDTVAYLGKVNNTGVLGAFKVCGRTLRCARNFSPVIGNGVQHLSA